MRPFQDLPEKPQLTVQNNLNAFQDPIEGIMLIEETTHAG